MDLPPEIPQFQVLRLSPPGRGAIGVVEVRGVGAAQAVARTFRGRVNPGELAEPRVSYGRFVDLAGETIDDGLVVCHPGEVPKYWLTPHGNPLLLGRLIEVLERLGGSRVAADSAHLFSAHGDARIAREAQLGLADAHTAGAVAFLLEQAGTDFGFAAWAVRAEAGHVGSQEVEAVVARARVGRALLEPARVVLAGAPNAGKSTLFNRLVGEARVVVHSEPGTTRDLIQEVITLGDFPIRLIDGAGLRATDDPVERLGVARMRQAVGEADLVVWLDSLEADDDSVGERPVGRGLSLHIHSKADQIRADRGLFGARAANLRVSGLTGEGVEELVQSILGLLFGGPRAPRGVAVPFLARHEELLRAALERLRAGEDARVAFAALNDNGDRSPTEGSKP